jgi:hypothetical protein
MVIGFVCSHYGKFVPILKYLLFKNNCETEISIKPRPSCTVSILLVITFIVHHLISQALCYFHNMCVQMMVTNHHTK